MSDIRVSVSFPKSTAVYAGETLQCKITFKNIAPKPGASGLSSSILSSVALTGSERRASRIGTPLQIPGAGGEPKWTGPRNPTASRPLSSGYKAPPSASKTPVTALPPATPTSPTSAPGSHRHKRSVSIVSLSSDIGDGSPVLRSPPLLASRPRGHGRSASLQITTGAGRSHPSSPSSGIVIRETTGCLC